MGMEYEALFSAWPYNLAADAWGRTRFLLHCSPAFLEFVFGNEEVFTQTEAKVLKHIYAASGGSEEAAAWFGLPEGQVSEVMDAALQKLREYAKAQMIPLEGRGTVAVVPEEEPQEADGGTGDDGLMSRPIEELELSVRAYNGLTRAGIRTVGDLVARTPSQLRGIKSFGRLSLLEVEGKVKELGLSLREEPG